VRVLLAALLVLTPLALAAPPATVVKIDGFLAAGEQARLVIEADALHLAVRTIALPVHVRVVAAANGTTMYERWDQFHNATAATVPGRYVVTLSDEGNGSVGYFLTLEGPGLTIVDSSGIRSFAPEAWKMPATTTLTVALALGIAVRRLRA